MPEYDAFGREIGENTLEGLGGDSSIPDRQPATPDWEATAEALRKSAAAREQTKAAAVEAAASLAPAPEPAVFSAGSATTTAAPPAAPPQFTSSRRIPRSLGCLFSLIVLGVVFGFIALAAVGLFGAAQNAIDDVTDTIEAVKPAPELSGITGESLIAPANLAPALQTLAKDGRRAVQVTVWPNRASAVVLDGARGRSVQLSADGSTVRSDPQPMGGNVPSLALRSLDPDAPARLVRRSAARFKVRPEGINYVIASPDPIDRGAHRWIAYFKNGIYVEGDEKGTVTRRIS